MSGEARREAIHAALQAAGPMPDPDIEPGEDLSPGALLSGVPMGDAGRTEMPLHDPGTGPIVWVAECDHACVVGMLVMVFATQAERTDWAREHRAALGHHVIEYQRRSHVTT